MAKHEVVIHENTGATKERAPYLGSYIAKETVKEPSFALTACMKAGMSAIQFRAIIDGSLQAIEELERSGLVRVHTDLGVVCAVITGSFPTADAAPDPERNKLNLCIRLADDIRLSLADAVPAIVADDSLTKLRVDNVMDLETPRPYNLIHGQGVFRVAGFNMVLDDEGAEAYLTDKYGVKYPLAVDEVVSKQLFKAHTAALLEPGDYKLVVKSRAGDAEGPLQTSFRKVKYLKVTPPVPTVEVTAVNGQGGEDDVFIFWDGYCRVKGHNLMLLDGDTVKIKGTSKSGAAVEHVFENVEYLPETDQILIDISEEEAQPFKDNWDGDKQLTFVVTSRGGVAASEPQVVAHDVAFGG